MSVMKFVGFTFFAFVAHLLYAQDSRDRDWEPIVMERETLDFMPLGGATQGQSIKQWYAERVVV